MSSKPLVSCLCVTEDRAAFLPWLLWNFQRQSWPHRELVIVSGSEVPHAIARAGGVRVISVARGTSVPDKRNVGLDAASGHIVAWFDDDDWQHPERLVRLVHALQADDSPRAAFAGWSAAWFLDLERLRCERYPNPHGTGPGVVFNGAGFSIETARSVRFDPAVLRASDSRWLAGIRARHPGRWRILAGDDGFFWLCHATNLSNPARRRGCRDPIEYLRRAIGPAWRDTDEQLRALRERISAPAAALDTPSSP